MYEVILMTNITNKEKLTQATIKALQGNLENDIDTKETCKDHLTKLFECYAEENHITEFINTLINLVLKFADDEGIIYILQWCQEHNV